MPQVAALISQLFPRQQKPRQPAAAATLLNLTIYRCSEGALASNQPSKFTYSRCGACSAAAARLRSAGSAKRGPAEFLPTRGCRASAERAGKALPRTRALRGILQVCSRVKEAFLTLQLLSARGGDCCSPSGLEEKHHPCSWASNLLPTLVFNLKGFCLTVFFHAY